MGRPGEADGRARFESLEKWWGQGAAAAPVASAAPPAPRAPTPGPRPSVDPAALPDPLPFPRLNPTANIGRAWLLAQGPDYDAVGNGRRLVTLTFDDGPFPETTPHILKTLADAKVHASFFLIGKYLQGHDARGIATRQVAADIAAGGHMIGNHTRDHQLLTSITHTQALAEIDDGEAAIERVIGKRPVLFRPPYGQLDVFTEEQLASRGAEVVLWSVEAEDMKEPDSDKLAESLEKQIEYAGGGIVLLHDIRWSTVEALPKLLAWLKQRRWNPKDPDRVGYEVVDLTTYIRETAAHPQPYKDRAEVERARAAAYAKMARAERHRPKNDLPADLAF